MSDFSHGLSKVYGPSDNVFPPFRTRDKNACIN